MCVMVVHVGCDERQTHDSTRQQHTAPVTHTVALALAHGVHGWVETLMRCVCALECDLSMHMIHEHMHVTVRDACVVCPVLSMSAVRQ